MKQRLLKILSVCMVSLCLVSLTACGGAEESVTLDETVKENLATMSEQLTEAIIPLTDEEIQNYKTSADSFTANAVAAWESSKEELGELKETGETAVEYDGDEYTVTVPAAFEGADANFVYIFPDENSAPESLTIDVLLPMSVNIQRAAMNTIMGLGTVFVMLIFLSFVIYLMGKICVSFQKKPNKKAADPVPLAPVAAPVVEEVVEETDDTELIAVIAAAIAASEGTSPDGFVVRSVRKVNRRKW